MTMEVDAPHSSSQPPDAAAGQTKGGGASNQAAAAQQQQQEKTIKVHPLAIISISDHHTRVTCGGSNLSPDAPVLGLLFGIQDGLEIRITDAEEVEYSFATTTAGTGGFGGGTEAERSQHRESIKTKINLHREVFPQHEVMGWYRVGGGRGEATGASMAMASPDVTEEDLQIHNTSWKEYNESPLFLLMNAAANDESSLSNNAPAAGEDGKPSAATAGDESQDELPIAIFESLVTMGVGVGEAGGEAMDSGSGAIGGGGQFRAVFVGLDFELNTGEPERIAVEKVFKAQANDGASGLDTQFQSLSSSIQSMNTRISTLLTYLRRVQAGELPPDYKLLRQISSLLRQLPSITNQFQLANEFHREYDDALVVTYLATIARTARVVQGYSEKFRVGYEGSTSSAKDLRSRGGGVY